MAAAVLEKLESRRLFTSLTLLTHGWNGTLTQWIQTTANDMTSRLGGSSQMTTYILTLTPDNTGALQGSIQRVDGSSSPQSTNTGNIILMVDWTSVSTNPSYTLAYVGSVIADYLMDDPVEGVTLASLPIHEASQSRGCELLDAINFTLGQAGVWVDQETQLDPHPIPEMNDPQPVLYDNVAFSDVYWQNDGNPADADGSGQPVDGAYNQNINWIESDDSGYASAHDAVTGYYVGTVGLNETQSGEGPIISDWYQGTSDRPARDATGFYYSALIGGPRPLSGVWAASGGTGDRTPTGQTGAQWPNMTDLSITNGSSFESGATIDLRDIHQDRGGSDTITYFLDSDTNPYNGDTANIGTRALKKSTAIAADRPSFTLGNVSPGTYWIGAKITNAQGLVRYAYAPSQITVAPGQAVTSGFDATYYDSDFSGSQQVQRVDNMIDFNFAQTPVEGGSTLSADNLAANWVGHVIAPASGDFTFYSTARGRVIIWINGEEILDHTGNGTTPVRSEKAVLNKGQRYLIRVKYFGPSPGQSALIQIAWGSPTVAKKTLLGGSFDGPDQDSAIVKLLK